MLIQTKYIQGATATATYPRRQNSKWSSLGKEVRTSQVSYTCYTHSVVKYQLCWHEQWTLRQLELTWWKTTRSWSWLLTTQICAGNDLEHTNNNTPNWQCVLYVSFVFNVIVLAIAMGNTIVLENPILPDRATGAGKLLLTLDLRT